MQFESRAKDVVHGRLLAGMNAGLDASVAEAQQRAVKVTGTWASSITRTDVVERPGHLVGKVGSALVSARAHERGAYVAAKRYPTLVIRLSDGTYRRPKAVRIPAHPVIVPGVRAAFARGFAAGAGGVGVSAVTTRGSRARRSPR